MQQPKIPNYLPKIIEAVAAGDLSQPEGVKHIIVQHDSWCRVYRRKPCNCNPDITFCKGSA